MTKRTARVNVLDNGKELFEMSQDSRDSLKTGVKKNKALVKLTMIKTCYKAFTKYKHHMNIEDLQIFDKAIKEGNITRAHCTVVLAHMREVAAGSN